MFLLSSEYGATPTADSLQMALHESSRRGESQAHAGRRRGARSEANRKNERAPWARRGIDRAGQLDPAFDRTIGSPVFSASATTGAKGPARAATSRRRRAWTRCSRLPYFHLKIGIGGSPAYANAATKAIRPNILILGSVDETILPHHATKAGCFRQPRHGHRRKLARQRLQKRDDVLDLRVAEIPVELRLAHHAHGFIERRH